MNRKLASIKKIDSINQIDGADAIECAVLGGWKVVVKKGEYKAGDLAVYCEIDSWVPKELAPFLSKGKEPREYQGVKGERLRTVRLRKQLSQGLLLKGHICPTGLMVQNQNGFSHIFQEGDDVSEWLKIQKWEPPVNAQLAGDAKSTFPSSIRKTDLERCQNLAKELAKAKEQGIEFEVTEKLEGSSMTCYLIDGVFGVCSRNLDLKETEGNTFWATARKLKVEEAMRSAQLSEDWAIQGELVGPGIQGNIYKLSSHQFHVFDVFDIKTGEYLSPEKRRVLVNRLGLVHVPFELSITLRSLPDGIDELLLFAESQSRLNKDQAREGVVFKQVDGDMRFKVINNAYLVSSAN
jgi:RNA ligase (TIGR02306 family)